MNLRQTHTIAELGVSRVVYDEIAGKLRAAGYDHAFGDDGLIDLSGLGISAELAAAPDHVPDAGKMIAPVAGQPDSTEQALGLYAIQADEIKTLLDEHAPHTTGNIQARVAQILAAQPEAMEVLRELVAQMAAKKQVLASGTISGKLYTLKGWHEDGIKVAWDRARLACPEALKS